MITKRKIFKYKHYYKITNNKHLINFKKNNNGHQFMYYYI